MIIRLSRLARTSWLVAASVLLCNGCVHRIHVAPAPSVVVDHPIPHTAQVVVPFLSIEGADHMPGIPVFEWPAKDFRAATIAYIQTRQTFTSAGQEPGALTLTIKAWLTMRSRGTYRYAIRLESELGLPGKPATKSYVSEQEEEGSRIRWTTASDQDPIARAVQGALDQLLTQIEADAPLYRRIEKNSG